MNQNGQDKKRLELWEQYEDAYIQMLVYEVAKMEGEELLEKNDRLKNDPDFQVPESITEKCLETIRREVAKREKQKRIASIRRIAIRVACVAAILGAMVVTACAAVPSFRRAALNLLIQTSEVSTRLVLGDQASTNTNPKGVTQVQDEPTDLFGYAIPEIPSGFMFEETQVHDEFTWAQYFDAHMNIIKISVYRDVETGLNLDTEDAEVEEIKVHGNIGILSVKDDFTSIAWNDPQTGCFIMVAGVGVDYEVVLQFAEAVVYKPE